MQSGMLLVGLIAAVGGINLAARVVRAVTARRTLRAAAPRESPLHTAARDDWYVFFRPADLCDGRNAAVSGEATVNPPPLHLPPADVRRAARRRSDTRPRLQV